MGKKKGPKMKLAHPPGHIFWKTEPVVDKLSLYIERIVEEQNQESSDGADTGRDNESTRSNDTKETAKNNEDKVRRIVERIYAKLFTDDLMYAKMFELPPKDLASGNGLYFRKVTEKQYECRLFLRRFIDQNYCQLIFGAQSDIPPGMAIYKLNDNLTNEQKAFVKDEWGPCMDDEGFMSPAKMYPWFAMGIVNAVQNIIDEESDKASDESGEDNGSLGDFDSVEVEGEYPLIKIVIPPEKDADADNVSNGENISDLIDSSSTNSSVKENNGSKEEYPRGKSEKAGPDSANNATNKEKKSAKAQWYPRGKGNSGNNENQKEMVTPQSTPRSSKGSTEPSSRTYSSFSTDVGTIQDDIKEEPVVIIIKPAIKGYGLPRSVKLQHALPKQKPYCEKGKACLQEIQDKLEDGQSLWYLEAATIKMSADVEKSARFRSTFRKIGRESKFWNISFGPVTDIIQKRTLEAYNEHEFPIDLEKVKACLNMMKIHHGWTCISDVFIDTAILNVVKANMLTMRSLGECTKKVLQFLQGVAASQSCASFLQPNVNIAQDIIAKEGAWVSEEIKQVLEEIEQDPGYVLIYIGYNKTCDGRSTRNSIC